MFQIGNTHGVFGGAWDKPYLQALRMELAKGGKNHQLLRRIAAKHLEMCGNGHPWAIKELIERLDGKVPQEQRVFSQNVTVELSDADIQRRLLELHATDVTPTSGARSKKDNDINNNDMLPDNNEAA